VDAAEGVFCKRLAHALPGDPGPVPDCRGTLDPAALDAELHKITGRPLKPGLVHLYPDGAGALEAIHALIDGATCRLDVCMFIWDNDPVGWDVARRLAAHASPGCPVRVLVDGCGNLIYGLPDEATAGEVNAVVCWLARQPHVEVIRTRDPFGNFDHRKLIVADGRAAWSGDRNFTAPSFFENRDLSFVVEGPLAADQDAAFEASWHDQGGPPSPPLPAPPPAETNACARLVTTGPEGHDLAHAVYHALDHARHHVFVENPYLMDNAFICKLMAARRRGVDVRVVSTVRGNSPTVNSANRAIVDRLLRAGIRVYLYPGFTHAKTMAVDGRWAYLGTGNFDPLSLRYDREQGLAVGSGPLIAELEERVFLADLNPEWELHEPLPLSLSDRLVEAVAGLFL
jgi:cardiolipin synthase